MSELTHDEQLRLEALEQSICLIDHTNPYKSNLQFRLECARSIEHYLLTGEIQKPATVLEIVKDKQP